MGTTVARRNDAGLTAKMVAILPFIAVAESIRAGVDNYKAETGDNADSYHHICKTWSKDTKWLKALDEAQLVFEQDMRRRVQQRIIANLDTATEALVDITKSDRPDKARGAEDILTLGGYDVGKGTTLNVTNIQATSGKQTTFADRVRSGASKRFPDIIEPPVDIVSTEDAE